jgi:bacterioferritin-associated ferredoxin
VELDDKVCLCFRITRRKLENYARIHNIRVASQLSECGGAGTGCGWCVPFLKQIFARGTGQRVELETVSAMDYAKRRADYVKSGKGTPPPGAEPLPQTGQTAQTATDLVPPETLPRGNDSCPGGGNADAGEEAG